MWCLEISIYDVDFRDVAVWYVIDGLGLCSFAFKGGQYYLEV
jgi:hypothetical protein